MSRIPEYLVKMEINGEEYVRFEPYKKQIDSLTEEIALWEKDFNTLKSRCDTLRAHEDFVSRRYGAIEIVNIRDWKNELPLEPIDVASMLIKAKMECEIPEIQRALFGVGEKVECDRYSDDDLRQIAEHLLVYCNHNQEDNVE